MSQPAGSGPLTTIGGGIQRAARSRWARPLFGIAALAGALAPVLWIVAPWDSLAEQVWFVLASLAGPVFWGSLGVLIGDRGSRTWAVPLAIAVYLVPPFLAIGWGALHEYGWGLSWFVAAWPVTLLRFAVVVPFVPET